LRLPALSWRTQTRINSAAKKAMVGDLIYFARSSAKRFASKKPYGNFDFPQADNCLIGRRISRSESGTIPIGAA
jgi:hypothetical protein